MSRGAKKTKRPAAPASNDDLSVSPLVISIIEDDDDTRASLSDILALDRHQVFAYPSADALVQSAPLPPVDVVLMDRKLPDGMAEDLLPKLTALVKGAEFIVVTAYADMEAAIAAMRHGASDFLIKPVDPDALRATLRRIAEKREVENELYRQRRFAEKLLETAEAIILILNPQGRIVRANNYFLETTGYRFEEIGDADWFEQFVPGPDRDQIRRLFQQTVDQIKTRGITNPILRKDGTECQVRWSNSTLRDASGRTTAVLCIGLDVTDFLQTQQKLLQQERLAAIGATMAGLAHESRNALQRIQNAVALLGDELVGQPEALHDLHKIERAGKHIKDLLDEVRSYAAPINLELTATTMPDVWRRAWGSIAETADAGEVAIHERMAVGSSGTSPAETTLHLDSRRMEQVFRNLFENALDASNGNVEITIESAIADNKLMVTLSDNGPGVPESHQRTLFEAFATSKPTGTGLGLAICRRIVEAHDGELVLLPTATGAAFQLTFPI